LPIWGKISLKSLALILKRLGQINVPPWYTFAGHAAALAAIVTVEFSRTAARSASVVVLTAATGPRGGSCSRHLLQSLAAQDVGIRGLHALQLGLAHLIDVVGAAKLVLDQVRKLPRLGHHGPGESGDAIADVAPHIAQALAHISQDLARLTVLALRLELVILQVLGPLCVVVQLFLQLRDIVCALLVLFLKDSLSRNKKLIIFTFKV